MKTKKQFQSEALQRAYEEIVGNDQQRQADFGKESRQLN